MANPSLVTSWVGRCPADGQMDIPGQLLEPPWSKPGWVSVSEQLRAGPGSSLHHELGAQPSQGCGSPPAAGSGCCLQAFPERCSSSPVPASSIRLICNEATNNTTPTAFRGARAARWGSPRNRREAGARRAADSCGIWAQLPKKATQSPWPLCTPPAAPCPAALPGSPTLLQPARKHKHCLSNSIRLPDVDAEPALCPALPSVLLTIGEVERFFFS